MSPSNAPVEFALRQIGNSIYVIAANKSPRAQTVRFAGSILRNKKAKVHFEQHAARVRGDTLKDKFQGFGVHVYRLE
jgi:hypothetical protein